MSKAHAGYPYTETDNQWTPCLKDEDLIKEMFHEICDLTIEAIKDCHQILHEKANEILAFLAADSEHKPIQCHLSLAFALKGSSLSIEVMRKLVNDLCDNCTEHDIDVLCEVYDGQFLQLILKDDNAQPKTKMQLSKDILVQCKKKSKRNLIKYLLPDAIKDGNTLDNISTPHNKAHLYEGHLLTYQHLPVFWEMIQQLKFFYLSLVMIQLLLHSFDFETNLLLLIFLQQGE